jgi:hypothetical protein
MAVGIDREQTESEKSDYDALGKITPKEKFLKELARVEMEHVRNSMPFDGQCAKADFNEQLEQLERESENRTGFISPMFIEKHLKMPDLNDYGKLSRFDVIKEDIDMEMQNINGLRSSVKCGVTVMYKCKKRGHGCSVAYSNEVYDDRFGDKKKKVDDK